MIRKYKQAKVAISIDSDQLVLFLCCRYCNLSSNPVGLDADRHAVTQSLLNTEPQKLQIILVPIYLHVLWHEKVAIDTIMKLSYKTIYTWTYLSVNAIDHDIWRNRRLALKRGPPPLLSNNIRRTCYLFCVPNLKVFYPTYAFFSSVLYFLQ